jgi:hypothetical protein
MNYLYWWKNLDRLFEYFHRQFEHQHDYRNQSEYSVKYQCIAFFYPVVAVSLATPRPRSSISLWTTIDLPRIELNDLGSNWMMKSSKLMIALPNWSDLEQTSVKERPTLIVWENLLTKCFLNLQRVVCLSDRI